VHSFSGESLEEVFVVLALTSQLVPIAIRAAHIGTIDASMVDPRTVFRTALELGAASIIVGHNHPSGDPTPSRADLETTQALARASLILGIPLEDHVIVSSRFGFRYTSLAAANLK
jgi:DNA repair protein RadC